MQTSFELFTQSFPPLRSLTSPKEVCVEGHQYIRAQLSEKPCHIYVLKRHIYLHRRNEFNAAARCKDKIFSFLLEGQYQKLTEKLCHNLCARFLHPQDDETFTDNSKVLYVRHSTQPTCHVSNCFVKEWRRNN